MWNMEKHITIPNMKEDSVVKDINCNVKWQNIIQQWESIISTRKVRFLSPDLRGD